MSDNPKSTFARRVRAAKPRGKRYDIRDDVIPSLFLRLHDLRRTAASQAVMSGEGLPLVGRLLGHNRHRTTAGYAHLADAHLVEAAEKVGAIIATAMASQRSRPITHRQ